MKTPELPAPDAKCGVKIDYVAKRLALVLGPLGFKRKARQFARAAGTGDEAHWQIIQLQADQWNEGPRGAFFVNLALQFPALMRLASRRPGMEWLAQHFDEVNDSLGQRRERLGHLQSELPATHPCARPAHSDEFKLNRSSDIAALADGVVQAALEVGVPWLAQHASLRALADFEGSLRTADVDVRVAAAVLLGDRARAQQILVDRRERFALADARYLASARSWYGSMGLDVSMLPVEAQPPRPGAWEQKRLAAQQAEGSQHAQRAEAIRAQAVCAALSERGPKAAHEGAAGSRPVLPPAALAAAWVAEHRAQCRHDPAPLADLPSGRDAAALDATGREAVLCALLQQLVALEQSASPRDPLQPKVDEFDVDASVKALLTTLLPTLPGATEATALAVVDTMNGLVTRWQQELVTGGYPWGFALLVRWLTGAAGAPHRAALQPAIARWLTAYTAFSLAAQDTLSRTLDAHQAAAAADPAHPLHEILREAREREAELAAKQPLPSAEELRRRIAEYPEQRMCPADKQAVAALRRDLARDPATGHLPVAWDRDDWGRAAQRAWQVAPAALRDSVTPMLQRWLEGTDTRPTQTFLRALRAQVAALPAPVATIWRNWVLQRLADFEASSGRTEWATTGPRPGIGARLGEASENLLIGLLWWAWHDTALQADALEPVLHKVASGAWQRLPEVGARAPSVGGLVLRMCAGLGDAARQRVAALADTHGAPRQLRQAVQRALHDPLSR